KVKKSAKKKGGKAKESQNIQKPATNVDEELHMLNKSIKKEGRNIGIEVEHEIDIEVTRARRALHAAVQVKWYAVLYTLSIAVLAHYLGFPTSFFVHLIFGGFLLWLTHHMHKNKKYGLALRVFWTGIMILPLYWIYLWLDDFMSLSIIVLYAIAFIISIALYFHHTSREIERELHQSYARTFMVVWYSHLVAYAAAVLAAYFLGGALVGEAFISMMYLMFMWAIPPFFVYFYLNKLLYLRFFDPVHYKADSLKALKHGLAYTGMFIACLALIYLLTAVHATIQERDNSLVKIDEAIIDLRNISVKIEAQDEYGDITGLEVTQELLDETDKLIQTLESRKSVVTQSFGIWDYLSDKYFEVLTRKRLGLTFLLLNKDDVIEMTDDLLRYHNRTEEVNNTQALKQFVDANYQPYAESESLKEVKKHYYDNKNEYSYFMRDDAIYTFALSRGYHSGIGIFAPGNSRFSKRMYHLTSHLLLFRDLMLFSFEYITYNSRDTTNPEVLDNLYYNRDARESEQSKTVRYMILYKNYKAIHG
ncbi:hypothetical protein ACFL0V_06185, partial [Nanoarchaeota archaeon]